jgi:hypothetical protein
MNIHPYRVALANENRKDQKINYRSSWKTDGSQVQVSSIVDFVKLDDWSAENSIDHVDVIKIDVDGNEYSVLDGGRKLLEKYKPMVIAEVGAWHFADTASNPWSILADLGYHFWDLKSKEEYSSLMQIRKRLPNEDPEMGFSINLVASIRGNPWSLQQ